MLRDERAHRSAERPAKKVHGIVGVQAVGRCDLLRGQRLQVVPSDVAGELIGSGQDVTFIHPLVSPLPGGGNASLSWVVDTTGTYTIAVDRGTGPYLMDLQVFRTELEQQNRRDHQILFLDFDGETIDATQIFGFGNPNANLSPLSS